MSTGKSSQRNIQARPLIVASVIAAILQAFQSMAAAPYFERVAGFRPFDTQFPLSTVAITIQLGAYGEGALGAYVAFALSEILAALSIAVLFVMLWRWLFSAFPNKIFTLLRGGGILIAPFAAPICDVAETLGFARLISGVSDSVYETTMEFSILMHNLKFAFQDMRFYFTLFFIAVPVVNWLRQPDDRTS